MWNIVEAKGTFYQPGICPNFDICHNMANARVKIDSRLPYGSYYMFEKSQVGEEGHP